MRAKRTLSDSGVGFETPHGAELHARLPSVLEVIYLIFNEGYAATAGAGLDAAGALPRGAPPRPHPRRARARRRRGPRPGGADGDPGVAARARVDADGDPILLGEQNRGRWDPLLIRRGLAALARAKATGGAPGPYALQAAIAAHHARARTFAETDWARIAALYATLAVVAPSPVVEVNRAVAVAMAEGPERGLAVLDGVAGHAAMQGYHLLPSVRGDFQGSGAWTKPEPSSPALRH